LPSFGLEFVAKCITWYTVYFHATGSLTQVVSDADGTFKIRLKPNENEFVIVTINHSGFMPFSEQLEVGVKDEVVLEVKLSKK
jgi:hypothetical protein